MQGDDLRALRKRARMTQAEFGEAMGISGGYVGEMERGEKEIDKRTELAARFLALATEFTPAQSAGQLAVAASSPSP